MSDSQDLESRARGMGWQPQESFKGDPEKWVDAEEFVRRGEEVLPIVRANNRKLEEKVETLMAQNQQLTEAVREQRESMDALIEHSQAELKSRLEAQKKALKTELRQAQRDDNDDLAGELEDRLEETDEALGKLKDKPVKKPDPTDEPPKEAPEFRPWLAKNPWYGGATRADQAKTAAADRFAADAAKQGLRGQAFFDAVDAALAEVYPPQRRADSSEDGRPSGGGSGSSSSSGSGFNALPADAKAYARSQVTKFVGPNKMFKTEADWFSYYTKQYNTEAA